MALLHSDFVNGLAASLHVPSAVDQVDIISMTAENQQGNTATCKIQIRHRIHGLPNPRLLTFGGFPLHYKEADLGFNGNTFVLLVTDEKDKVHKLKERI